MTILSFVGALQLLALTLLVVEQYFYCFGISAAHLAGGLPWQ